MKKFSCLFLFLFPILLIGNMLSIPKEINYNFVVPDDFSSIQNAIGYSFDGYVILVRPGIYSENIDFEGKNITVASFYLFEKDEKIIEETVLQSTNGESVVSFRNKEKASAKLIGFTIKNGRGNSGSFDRFLTEEIAPNFSQLPYFSSQVHKWGGGIFCLYANPTLRDLKIEENTADYGGGIFLFSSSTKMKNILFRQNQATEDGGGLLAYFSNPSLEDVVFANNEAEKGGGAAFVYSSSPRFVRTVFHRNNAARKGGAIYSFLNCGFSLKNCLLIRNYAKYGGGIYLNNSDPQIRNVTFFGNTGGIYCDNDSNPFVENSVLWENKPNEIIFAPMFEKNSVSIRFSDIHKGEAGIGNRFSGVLNWEKGNIEFYPFFRDSENNDFTLIAGSPCINSGNPDLEFNDKDRTRNDMGAFGGISGNLSLWENGLWYEKWINYETKTEK